MRKQLIPKRDLEDLVQVICSILDVHSMYFIGAQHEKTSSSYFFDKQKISSKKHKYNLTLVIISKEYVAEPKYFINKVFTKLKQKVKIYPLLYTTNEFNYRLNYGDNFLTRVISPQNELFSKDNVVVTGYCAHPFVYAKIKKEWEFRLNRVFYFEDKVDTCADFRDEAAKMFLLSQAFQQTCAALLAVFWEYKPSIFDLNYLLNLCNHFSSSPSIIFPKTSFRSQRVYNALCHAQYNLYYKSNIDISEEDIDNAHHLLVQFFNKAKMEGAIKLDELKQIHQTSAIK